MARTRLIWHLFPSYLLITLISLVAVTWFASHSWKQFHLKQTAGNLEGRARLVENYLRLKGDRTEAEIDRLCKDLGKLAATRFTVVRTSGEVIGDTYEDPAVMDIHGDRPEIQAALQGKVGLSTRYSFTRRQDLMYVAVPWQEPGQVRGVVRASVPLAEIAGELRSLYGKIALGAVIIAVIMALFSLVIARRFTRPLEEMERGARRFFQGQLERKLPLPAAAELASLAEALNHMAAQLEDRLQTLMRHGQEQEAILAAMTEGVLAFNREGYLITLNRAAAEMLRVDLAAIRQAHLQEVVKDPDLRWFINRLLSSPKTLQSEVTLKGNGLKVLQVKGTPLRDQEETLLGTLVVLQDITHLRRLETARRDFVANVSHELRTPITSIKGYVETLLAGALKEPENAEKFLRIIAQQSERLNTLIDDLLSLSRIEQEAERHQIAFTRGYVKEVLEAARQVCESKAAAKGVALEVSCPENLRASFNAPLLEQAVTNLVDNAIKFSSPGSRVVVEAQALPREVVIRVQDQGSGIPAEHLDRIFERFYRVDAGRSRKEGGTGLGLAIVKHIAQAHGGRVTVASTPGQGSTFSLIIPES